MNPTPVVAIAAAQAAAAGRLDPKAESQASQRAAPAALSRLPHGVGPVQRRRALLTHSLPMCHHTPGGLL